MATTSLWHIEGRLKDLIDYVENPEKTASKTPELQDLYNVFSYAVRAFFKEDARENITDKVQRIILKSDDNSKEI